MHIKQIIIQGFKSYKDQTVIEPFSPGLNVIVGRNGSGKSNFFAAIRFVLSDAYTGMGREERQALLHEGSGSAVMSAYVEVIFDNSDERFPTGKPELILRRTIGLKKDEYSLDRKNATKQDVMNLLESAGFSRSNPYYIVPQGRVTTLTNMKDHERLNLLKEVAGTQVYEARRTESLKIIQETENKRSKIDDLLGYIEERLSELDEEKEELRQYQDKDREHRCLQYTLLYREQQELQKALAAINDQRSNGLEESDNYRESIERLEQELLSLDDELEKGRQTLEYAQLEKQQLEDEKRESQRELAKNELDLQTLSSGQSAAHAAKSKHDQELRQVQQAIRDRDSQLSKILPQFNSSKTKENDVRVRLNDAQSTRKHLFDKQARSSQFTSKKERDSNLKEQIGEISQQLESFQSIANQKDQEIQDLESEITEIEMSIRKGSDELNNFSGNQGSLASELSKAKEAQDQLLDQRRLLWRNEQRIESEVNAARSNLKSAEDSLQRMTDRSTWQGIKTIREIAERQKLSGVFGTLGELFEVPEAYRTAVEVTAGQSLFHYVVDTDETAEKLLEVLNKQKGGRVSFMPLNRIRSKPTNLPKASDAVPMLSKFRYDSEYDKAFQQVFGKSVICPNLSVAAQYARSHGVSAITSAGDRADKKGALTGGYHDIRHSRIEAIAKERKLRSAVGDQLKEQEKIRNDIKKIEHDINKALDKVKQIQMRQMHQDNSRDSLRDEIRSRGNQLQALRARIASYKQAKDNVSASLRNLTKQQQALDNEIKSEFKQSLTIQEQTELNSLGSTIQKLQYELQTLSTSRSALESTKDTLEVELQENLRPRLDQLELQDFEGSSSGSGNIEAQLKEKQAILKRIQNIVQDIENKISQAEFAVDNANQRLFSLHSQRGEKQTNLEELNRSIEKYQRRVERSLQKKSLVTSKLTECNRDIRDLGVLPDDAFKKYENMNSEKAQKRLGVVKESLKKFSHVNKKAFEQYKENTKQRDLLRRRREELNSSQQSIEELIEHLDQRKDEAIERTFRQVSREFATVFEKLVPAGKGRLIIQRKTDKQVRADEEDAESDAEKHREAVENYTGVGISVSFNSKHDEQQRIQQLSGGQKSLCALALVFAIQQCDPAPFYLFDEIDANLDAQYRTAVAQMIKALTERPTTTNNNRTGNSKRRRNKNADDDDDDNDDGSDNGDGDDGELGGQFICTTFRPEMVLVAEKCYGVTYTNKTSSIDVVNRDEALAFVDGAANGK